MRKTLTFLAILAVSASAHAGRRDGWIGRFFLDLLSLVS